MVNKEFVKQRVATFLKISAADLSDGMVLSDLVADSFMIVELMIDLQETCAIRLSHEDVSHIKTLGELTSLIATLAARRSTTPRTAEALVETTEG